MVKATQDAALSTHPQQRGQATGKKIIHIERGEYKRQE